MYSFSASFTLEILPLILEPAGARRGHIGGGWGCMDVEGACGAAQDGQQGFQGRGSQEPRPGSGASAAQQAVRAPVCAYASGQSTLLVHAAVWSPRTQCPVPILG